MIHPIGRFEENVLVGPPKLAAHGDERAAGVVNLVVFKPSQHDFKKYYDNEQHEDNCPPEIPLLHRFMTVPLGTASINWGTWNLERDSLRVT